MSSCTTSLIWFWLTCWKRCPSWFRSPTNLFVFFLHRMIRVKLPSFLTYGITIGLISVLAVRHDDDDYGKIFFFNRAKIFVLWLFEIVANPSMCTLDMNRGLSLKSLVAEKESWCVRRRMSSLKNHCNWDEYKFATTGQSQKDSSCSETHWLSGKE